MPISLLPFSKHSGTSPATRPRCGCSHLADPEAVQNRQKAQSLWIPLYLLAGLFVAELGTGLWSHSLSVLADAGHLLSDIAALGLTLLASWLAQRPAVGQATFGYRRVEILVALVNGLSLLVIAALIAGEAIARLQTPASVLGLPMLIGAVIGLVVNSLNITLLHQHSHDDLNLRGAFLHVVADALSSVSLILAALFVYFLNWSWVDGVGSLFVAGLTGLSAMPLVQESLEILMEYAPRSVDPAAVAATLNSYKAVERVEKLHIWTITSGQVMLCAHLIVESSNSEEREQLLKQLQAHLHQDGISESVLQLTSRAYTESFALHPLFTNKLASLLSSQQEPTK